MDKKIKVCHLTSAHTRYDTRIFHKECRSLFTEGYDVSLVVADGKGDEVKSGIKIYDVGKKNGRLKRFTQTTKKVYNKAIQVNADIYHFHDPELIFYANKLVKKKYKVIYDSHEDVPKQILSKYYLNFWLRRIISITYQLFEKRKSCNFSYIITATDFIKNRFLSVNKNVKSVKNFPDPKEIQVRCDWEEKQNVVCYIGAISRNRGIVESIIAVEKAGVKLDLAGKFSSDKLKSEVQQMSGWKFVKYNGFADRQQVNHILCKAKIGLVTLHPKINYLDALPIKLFEYMIAGIPVISSDIPLWRSIVDENKCGICVDPMKPRDIAKAINYLLANEKEAELMGENGRKAIKNKYNWEVEKEKLLNIYDNLVQ